MKKRIFCILLSLCLLLSYSVFASAAGIIGSLDEDDMVTDLAGTLEMTSSPSGAVAIGKNLSTGSTYYYRVNGDILANNTDVSRSTDGMIPAEVAYQYGETASPTQIIYGDDRVKVTDTSTLPYSAIAYVHAVFTVDAASGATITTFGTAWMFSPDAAATAAHVIYHEDYGWATQVIVTPGLCLDPPLISTGPYINGPFGCAVATEIAVSTQWFDSITPESDSPSYYHDWGVIRLNTSIGNNSGYLGFHYCSYNLVPSNLAEGENLRSVMVSGYASDRNALGDTSTINDEYFQYVSSGYIVGDITENTSIPTYRRIEHRADTTDGQSGAPLIYEGKSIGFARGATMLGAIENADLGITSQLYSFLLAYS